MKAVFLDYGTLGAATLDATPLERCLPGLERFETTPPSQVLERTRDAEYVLVNKTRLDAPILEAAMSLRYIGLAATGTDNVDIEEAAQRGIAVTNIVAYCTQSVAEHVLAMLLALAHSTHRYLDDVRLGAWQRADNFCLLDHPIRELSAMTLGIVGYGVLGRATAELAGRFGMRVLIARRRDSPARDDGRTAFDDVLREADVISLHCPLDETTRHLIGRRELERMRPSAFLINAARGGLVDSAALAHALEKGEIAAAAIDVLPQEPPRDGDPLLDYAGDNLLLTPHVAWASREARQRAIEELAANVLAFQNGERRNRIV